MNAWKRRQTDLCKEGGGAVKGQRRNIRGVELRSKLVSDPRGSCIIWNRSSQLSVWVRGCEGVWAAIGV
ncbi:hypothetical protein SUGI_0238370 [Cryptomeria japonica]|nr:hypothetical protein SUGI_0238370 [Cryptomeria japonica]